MSVISPAIPLRSKAPGAYLFLPRRMARGAFLKWLRRTHAWFGIWGAGLGLLFGTTGILLNHHAIMKIPAARTEQTEIQLPLPEPRPGDPAALSAWLGAKVGTDFSGARVTQEGARAVTWGGVSVQQPPRWQVSLRGPQRFIQAEYWLGNTYVTVKRGDANAFAVLTNLHKGVGMGVGWILLADTLAGAIVLLSLTGILLWTRLHGRRLGAAGLGLGSVGLALWFVCQAL